MSPLRAVAVSPAMVQQKAADLVETGERVLLLRGRPEWTHGDIKVGGSTVRVVPGVSQLGILDTINALGPGERVVVLTDRPPADLDDAVLVHAKGQQIYNPNEWAAVPRMFAGARSVGQDLRRLDWAATALLDHQPPGGWPRSAESAVTARHAIGALLAQMLGLVPGTELDPVMLMIELGRRDVRAVWADVDATLRGRLVAWSRDELGGPGAFALQVAQRQEHVTPLAVALALDVLWPEKGNDLDEGQVAARVRVESYVDGKAITPLLARAAAEAARAAVVRLGSRYESEVAVAIQQAEALLDDIGWAEGAERSTVLRAGFRARRRRLAAAIDAMPDAGGHPVEIAWNDLQLHHDAHESPDAEMAVRLVRWLAQPEAVTAGLADDVNRQMADGAWVDAALGAVRSDDPEVGAAYGRLLERVRERRRKRDELAAARLDETLSTPSGVEALGKLPLGVEGVLDGVVRPWRASMKGQRVLILVLDGLTAAIATQIGEVVRKLGLAEWIPESIGARLGVVSALPSVTSVSRTALFCGRVRKGGPDDEKRGLAEAFPGARVFHKGDLRAEQGAALPAVVVDALHNSRVPVVGAVINTIDDALHKNDVSGLSWDIDSLRPLRALLETAVAAGRMVVLTSDHGHVVERNGTRLDGADAEARWHAGGHPATAGEIEISGPRVVTETGKAVLVWRDDAHYGPVRAGYHGGASLAEVTVPVLVFQSARMREGADGWQEASPQAPGWWNNPIRSDAPTAGREVPVTAPKPGGKRRKPVAPETNHAGQGALFEETAARHAPALPKPATDLVGALLQSEYYTDQKELAGRQAKDIDQVVETMIRTLLSHGRRAHRDTVAAAAGIPVAEIEPTLAAVKRVLNVDGYAVISVEDGGTALQLDEGLLREQFGIDE